MIIRMSAAYRNFHPQNCSLRRVWSGFQRLSKSGIGTNTANAGDATRAAGMTGTDRWKVPEAGLWGPVADLNWRTLGNGDGRRVSCRSWARTGSPGAWASATQCQPPASPISGRWFPNPVVVECPQVVGIPGRGDCRDGRGQMQVVKNAGDDGRVGQKGEYDHGCGAPGTGKGVDMQGAMQQGCP